MIAALDSAATEEQGRPNRSELNGHIVTERLEPRASSANDSGASIQVILPSAVVAALDDYIATQPGLALGRSEAIQQVVAKALTGTLRKATAVVADLRAPFVAENAARVRSSAARAADEVLEGIRAPGDVKLARRNALIEQPKMVERARGKRLPRQ